MPEYNPESYIIPANVTDNGNVLNGNIKKKSAYEAVAIVVLGVALSFGLLWFIPLLAKVIITVVFVMIAFVALAGIKGESFVEYLIEVFFFKRKQRTMKFRLPRKEPEMKKRRLKK